MENKEYRSYKRNFCFDWNGTEITVSVDTNIKCEINDVYYYGTDCLNNLADNLCIELKTSDDVYNYDGSAPITAVEFETSDDCGTSY